MPGLAASVAAASLGENFHCEVTEPVPAGQSARDAAQRATRGIAIRRSRNVDRAS